MKSIYFRNQPGIVMSAVPVFMQKTGNYGMEKQMEDCKMEWGLFLYSTVYCLV